MKNISLRKVIKKLFIKKVVSDYIMEKYFKI